MASHNHLELLKGSWQNWNKWRNANPEVLADLARADLREVNLDFNEFTNVDLSQADVSGKDLSLKGFVSSLLVGTNFFGSKLYNTLFHLTDFSGANLTGANFVRATFAECKAINADFSKSNFNNCYFHHCNFKGSNFTEAKILCVQFVHCSLVSCCFSFSNLLLTKFDQNDCSKAIFSGANLTNASLIDVCIDEANFANARIFGLSAWEITGTATEQSNLIITKEGRPTITVDDLQVAQFVYLI